jgi:hypothetical protein
MKVLTTFLAVSLGLTGLSSQLHAQVSVGVQFPAYYDGVGGQLNGDYSTYPQGYFAGAYLQQYWNVANNSTGNGDGTPAGPLTNANFITNTGAPAGITYDSTGAASTVTFTLTGANDNRYSAGGAGFPTLNNGATGEYSQFNPNGNLSYFLQGGVEAVDGTGPETLSLGGLNPLDTYDVYAYVSSLNFAGSESATVTLGGTTYYLNTDGGTLTGLTPSTNNTGTDIPTADYVEFANISGASLLTDTLTETGTYTGLSGFQVVDLGSGTAAPEPSTWAMVLGGLGLLVWRVRARRV